MGVLQRFERRLGGMVEGAFAKAFKANVQPVEIASALQRECDQNALIVAADRTVVPNDFVVELGVDDHRRLAGYAEALSDELAAMVREHAEEQHYRFVGPVRVRFEETGELDTGVFRVRSGVAAAPTVSGGHVTHRGDDRAPADPHARVRGDVPRLVLAAGGQVYDGDAEALGEQRAIPLEREVTVIGRGTDCDVRLDDAGVSRRHAELRRGDDGVLLVDLGSTNGTVVNGHSIREQRLVDGDRVEVGETTFLFRVSAEDAP